MARAAVVMRQACAVRGIRMTDGYHLIRRVRMAVVAEVLLVLCPVGPLLGADAAHSRAH